MCEQLVENDTFFASFSRPADFEGLQWDFNYTTHSLAGVDVALAGEKWSVALAELFLNSAPRITEACVVKFRTSERSRWKSLTIPALRYVDKVELISLFIRHLPTEFDNIEKAFSLDNKLLHVKIVLPAGHYINIPQGIVSHFGILSPLLLWKPGENHLVTSEKSSEANLINISCNFAGDEAGDKGITQVLRTVDCTKPRIHFQPRNLHFFPLTTSHFLRVGLLFTWLKSDQIVYHTNRPDFLLRLKFRKSLPNF